MWPRPRRCSSISSASDDYRQRLQLAASGGRVDWSQNSSTVIGVWGGIANGDRGRERSRPVRLRDRGARCRGVLVIAWRARPRTSQDDCRALDREPEQSIRLCVQRRFPCLRYPTLSTRPQHSFMRRPGGRGGVTRRCAWTFGHAGGLRLRWSSQGSARPHHRTER